MLVSSTKCIIQSKKACNEVEYAAIQDYIKAFRANWKWVRETLPCCNGFQELNTNVFHLARATFY